MIIVSDVVAMKDRGAAQGLLGIAISLGSGLGPFVGGLFAQNVTWRWTFCKSSCSFCGSLRFSGRVAAEDRPAFQTPS